MTAVLTVAVAATLVVLFFVSHGQLSSGSRIESPHHMLLGSGWTRGWRHLPWIIPVIFAIFLMQQKAVNRNLIV